MEEEEVPDLIDVTVDDEVDGEVESEQVVKKVPITIVTGIQIHPIPLLRSFD